MQSTVSAVTRAEVEATAAATVMIGAAADPLAAAAGPAHANMLAVGEWGAVLAVLVWVGSLPEDLRPLPPLQVEEARQNGEQEEVVNEGIAAETAEGPCCRVVLASAVVG